MTVVHNPILRGFHPDPSIVKAGKDYYLATSTFEWFPGVMIYHSNNLSDWELVARPLNRLSQLNMEGVEDSGGVWAPCLSFCDGIFYLIYTNVRSYRGAFKDTPNFLVTASDIKGPWSEPIFLNASGFDPSLFHAPDGKKYLVNMLMDYRNYQTAFGGIVLQEYDPEQKRLVGERKNIFRGTPLGVTEGPHLYWHDGYYYLMTAEGGTGWGHAVTMARSREINGPYEPDPEGPMLTARHLPAWPLQKAGHASLVSGPEEEWYLVHLCSRPVGEKKRCILGRETALQKVVWEDGWLRLLDKTNVPALSVEVPDTHNGMLPEQKRGEWREDFDGDSWADELQTLRIPLGERASLKARPGWLRLYGGESPESTFRQSMLARRQQSFKIQAEVKMEFAPKNFQHMAGLIYYYNTKGYYYLYLTQDDSLGTVLSVLACDNGETFFPMGAGMPVQIQKTVWLRLCVKDDQAQFFWSADGNIFEPIGTVLDASKLSDDYPGGFTGAFIGMSCQDLEGNGIYADFDYFSYIEQE